MLNQSLSQKMLQKLSQQIQLMKLLQIPTANLEQRIEEELEANPALEEGDEIEDALDQLDNQLPEERVENNDESESYDDFDIGDYFDDEAISRFIKPMIIVIDPMKMIPTKEFLFQWRSFYELSLIN